MHIINIFVTSVQFQTDCLKTLGVVAYTNLLPYTEVLLQNCLLLKMPSILFYPITLEGHRGTTDEFATIPFHLDLFSAALVELAKSRAAENRSR